MILDLPGITSRIGSMAFDVKQAVEENRKRGLIIIGASAILILGIFIILKWRK